MARCSVFCLLAGMVILCLSSGISASEELLGSELYDLLDEELLQDEFVDLDVQLLGLNDFANKLRGCVHRVDKRALRPNENKILVQCIVPALRGPLVPQAIAARYALCVVKKNVTQAAKNAAQQVAHCMRS